MTKQVKTQSESMSKSVRMASLRNADQESKTLSGTIKVVRTFWRNGYKDAFAGLVSAADVMSINAPAILAKCLKDDKGQACTHSRKEEKNPDGSLLLDSNGKRVYVDVYTRDQMDSPQVVAFHHARGRGQVISRKGCGRTGVLVVVRFHHVRLRHCRRAV